MTHRNWIRLGFAAAVAAVTTAAVVLPAAAQQKAEPQAPKPAQIDRNGVIILVRGTILALDQANKTGNYTVLRDLGAPGFQQANTAARLGEIFVKQREDKLDLSGVAVIDPQLSVLPQIEASGLMRMAGFFPSVPSQVNFELLFAPVESQWRLFGISVSVGQAGPVAPSPPPPPAAKAPQAKAPANEKSAGEKKAATPNPNPVPAVPKQ